MKNILINSLVILILFVTLSNSQTIDKELLPELISPSNAGTEFQFSFIPIYFDENDNYNTVRIYLSSSVNCSVRINVPQSFIDTTLEVKANRVSEYSLHPKLVIPYSREMDDFLQIPERVVNRRAMKITSDSPIIVYALVRLKNYSEGFIVLPKNFWGREYNISTYNDFRNNTNTFAPSTAVIVGGYDNTRVTFRLGGNDKTRIMLSNMKDSLVTGESYVMNLNEGDIWVIPAVGNTNDLTGSTIRANRPVSVVTGNYCANVPMNISPCGHLIEQELPVTSFSYRYFVTPIIGRKRGSYVKVSAHAPNTDVMLNGSKQGTIAENYGKEGEGFLSFRVNNDNKPAVISSDKRINVVQFNYGKQDDEDDGIPFKTQVLSSEHFSKLIKFNLPALKISKFFVKNYANIIFKPDSEGNIPIDMTLTEFDANGNRKVKTVRELAKNPSVEFPDPETDGSRYHFLTIELPQSGNFLLKSSEPAGVMIYGNTLKEAYGYPAGIRMVNNDRPNDTLAPSVNFTPYANGEYAGEIIDMPTQSNVRSNLAMVHLIGDSSYNYRLNFNSFTPGVDNSTTFDIRPISITEPAQAYLRVVDFSGNDTILRFYYTNVPELPVIKLAEFAETKLCPDNDYKINFNVTQAEMQNTNRFRLRLGKVVPDKPGFPLAIAEVQGASPREINFKLPINLSTGDDYFLYIESTVPPIISDTIENISIYEMPDLSISGIRKAFSGNEYIYVTQKRNVIYKWTAVNGNITGADDSDTVRINWSDYRSGKVVLTYTSEDGCSIVREIQVDITPENNNKIEGLDLVCKTDEVFYNSVETTGTFQWSVSGGTIIGNSELPLIKIKWNDVGERLIKLRHTTMDGYIKDMSMTVTVADIPDKPTITRNLSILTSSSPNGNQWYFNGEIIAGARARTFDAASNEGIYTVRVTISGCTSELSDEYDYKIASVLLGDNDLDFEIYPNPAGDYVTVQLNNKFLKYFAATEKVKILDILGIEVISVSSALQSQLNENGLIIDVSQLPAGIYFIHIGNKIVKFAKM
ncbi:MAG: T9SS type A sorting domain-containing protein [Candidatus Kapabacteria bacterium]|nr:T9SS type A sorting domain-containing protein [Ignavibacteriota bacterium]MCW5884140.1 T9SS type A sorting domain-containing protein [Candidatus Kapabacteria bacterium]